MDKFGRSSLSSVNNNRRNIKSVYAIPTNTLSYGENGYYDAENRSICNLKEPIHKIDASTKAYVDSKLKELQHVENKLDALQRTIQIMENHITSMEERLYAVALEKIPSIEKHVNDSNNHMMELLKKSSENTKHGEIWDVIKQLKEKKIININV
ncbi:hypothetical protein ABEB36_015488 [Hypothenemus hampei]|uniref:Uncharacterized protein n=1 Tax=Hypothenemus hampei TaxID=57062 RepID=A0ABD1DZK5_HYPHA